MKKPKTTHRKPVKPGRRFRQRLGINRYDAVLALVIVGSLLVAPASLKWLIAVPLISLRVSVILLSKRKLRARERKLITLISEDLTRQAERAAQSIRLRPALEAATSTAQATEAVAAPPQLIQQAATTPNPPKERQVILADVYRRRHQAPISRRRYL